MSTGGYRGDLKNNVKEEVYTFLKDQDSTVSQLETFLVVFCYWF